MSEQMTMAQLLDSNIDDLADLPPLEVPNNGHYKMLLTVAPKKINDKDAIEFAYVVQEVLEMADATAAPPEVGTKFSESFMIGNEVGLGKFKAASKPLQEALGLVKISDFIAAAKQLTVAGTVKRRADKNDAEKHYASVSNLMLV